MGGIFIQHVCCCFYIVVFGPNKSQFSFHALSQDGAGVSFGLTDKGGPAPGGGCAWGARLPDELINGPGGGKVGGLRAGPIFGLIVRS